MLARLRLQHVHACSVSEKGKMFRKGVTRPEAINRTCGNVGEINLEERERKTEEGERERF